MHAWRSRVGGCDCGRRRRTKVKWLKNRRDGFRKRLRQRPLARSGWANGQLANGLGVALPRNMQPQSLKMLTNAITPTIDKVNIISVVVSSICQNKQDRKKKN
jgi:hypothetical protein